MPFSAVNSHSDQWPWFPKDGSHTAVCVQTPFKGSDPCNSSGNGIRPLVLKPAPVRVRTMGHSEVSQSSLLFSRPVKRISHFSWNLVTTKQNALALFAK